MNGVQILGSSINDENILDIVGEKIRSGNVLTSGKWGFSENGDSLVAAGITIDRVLVCEFNGKIYIKNIPYFDNIEAHLPQIELPGVLEENTIVNYEVIDGVFTEDRISSPGSTDISDSRFIKADFDKTLIRRTPGRNRISSYDVVVLSNGQIAIILND